MSFLGDIKRFNVKAEKAAEGIFRGTALSLFSNVVKLTPVDTGRARMNWMAGVNAPGDGGVKETIARARLGDSLFLTNNLPYIEALEYGSSKQAPKGMVRVTVTQFKQTVKKQVRTKS